VRAKFEHYLATHGEMSLEVRPWDIVLGGEVVSSDKDRERSLAFRLYRDGVRRLLFRPGLEWEEIIALIGILSVRYKGVRTQEDDVVTLLWRANFKHIEIAAVEGLVASEDDDSDMRVPEGALAGPRNAMQAMIFSAPYRFDYPWPRYTERTALEYRQLPPSLLARITEEDGTEAVPHECLQVAKELLIGLSDPLDPLTLDDVVPVLREIRGFLVGDNYLDTLLDLVRTVLHMAPSDENSRKELLAACADQDAVKRFILTLEPDEAAAPPALLELMSTAGGDHLETLLALFTSSLNHRNSPLLRQLLETQIRGQTARVTERLRTLGGHAAIDLFRLVVKADPNVAAEASVGFLGGTDEELQLAGLSFLETAPYGARVGRALVGAIDAGSSVVRLRRCILARHRESQPDPRREGSAVPPVSSRSPRRGGGELGRGRRQGQTTFQGVGPPIRPTRPVGPRPDRPPVGGGERARTSAWTRLGRSPGVVVAPYGRRPLPPSRGGAPAAQARNGGSAPCLMPSQRPRSSSAGPSREHGPRRTASSPPACVSWAPKWRTFSTACSHGSDTRSQQHRF
jgi:hypothetical protein